MVMVVVVMVVVVMYRRRWLSACGGTFDPKLRYCDPTTSKLVSGRVIPEEECNPISEVDRVALATEFTTYMNQVNSAAQGDTQLLGILKTSFPHSKMYEDLLFFAIPHLLKFPEKNTRSVRDF